MLQRPLLREAMREALREETRDSGGSASLADQPGPRIEARQEIDMKQVAAVPVGRNLQDRGAGKATVREQQVLAKPAPIARHLGVDRHP